MMRPYPAPQRPHDMRMTWSKLLFAHWAVEKEAMQRLLPPGLEVETFEGTTYLALVPFIMSGVRPRLCPAIPFTEDFLEMNMRTYVRHPATGKSGVWFISLDSSSPLSNWVARVTFHLRYLSATMHIASEEGDVLYRSRRAQKEGPYHPHPAPYGPPVEVVTRYGPTGPLPELDPLSAFLTNRYRLFSVSRAGQLYEAEIDHAPWPLQAAHAEFEKLDITQGLGLEISGTPHLLYSERLDVVGWRPTALPG